VDSTSTSFQIWRSGGEKMAGKRPAEEIPASQFYSSKTSLLNSSKHQETKRWLKKMKKIKLYQEGKEPLEPPEPPPIWRIFLKQAEAFAFQESLKRELYRFSFEEPENGFRKYLVASHKEFWKRYWFGC